MTVAVELIFQKPPDIVVDCHEIVCAALKWTEIKQLGVEGRGRGHVPQCPIDGDANVYTRQRIDHTEFYRHYHPV